MQQEKTLEAIQNLIAYYTDDFKEGCGRTGKQRLIYLTRSQSEIALRYGVPIGIRSKRYDFDIEHPQMPFPYTTISDTAALDRQLDASTTEELVSIHADMPKGLQRKMREYIMQIMEIECPEQLSPQKPSAPILGAEGNTFNLLCIVNRSLRQAGQQEQAEEMWQRVLDSRDCFTALAIMGEYVEFVEAYLPRPTPPIQIPTRRETNVRV